MNVSIPTEIAPDERRVAATPKSVKKMVKAGMVVAVESGAGSRSSIADAEYHEAGARLEPDLERLLGDADVVLKVQAPIHNAATGKHELDLMKKGATLIGCFWPMSNRDPILKAAERGLTVFSLDLLPRIARAQSMDVLSSMSNLTGYKSVLMAANSLGRILPMMTTAGGTLYPAQVLILGAGVAGLQAIATANRLGAVVKAFDIRPAVKEQVESLGAQFIELGVAQDQAEDAGGYAKEQSGDVRQRTQDVIAGHITDADIVITTALIPGKGAPLLITEEMVKSMKAGSVIVDLAVEQGGNCALSVAGKEVVVHHVTIQGFVNIPSMLPDHSSFVYANNVQKFLFHLYRDGAIHINTEDEITNGTLVTHAGEIVHPGVLEACR